MTTTNFRTHFSNITDPRIECCKKHNLIEIIFLFIAYIASGEKQGGY